MAAINLAFFITLSTVKASKLVPCSLLPHWNSMRFIVTGSLYDSNSMDEVKFATLYRRSSNTSQILWLVRYYVVIGSRTCRRCEISKKLTLNPTLKKIHHFFFSHTWGARFKYLPEGCPYMLMYSALHIIQWFSHILDVFTPKIRRKFFDFNIFMNHNKRGLHKTWKWSLNNVVHYK